MDNSGNLKPIQNRAHVLRLVLGHTTSFIYLFIYLTKFNLFEGVDGCACYYKASETPLS